MRPDLGEVDDAVLLIDAVPDVKHGGQPMTHQQAEVLQPVLRIAPIQGVCRQPALDGPDFFEDLRADPQAPARCATSRRRSRTARGQATW
jgi:hypothetical protein